MTALMILFKFIIFPGFLFTAALGLFSCFLDRKITARLQWRVGPSWYQPYVDILKLLGKELMMPEGVSRNLFILSPIAGLAGITLTSTIVWVVNMNRGATFVGDLIVVYYLLLLPSLALILGGFASNSPYATLGAGREIKMMLACELPFIIAVFTPVAKVGSILFGDILKFQTANGMMATHASCAIAFAVAIIVTAAKLGLVPFDAAEAEQEIAGGPLVEYSGGLLASFKLMKAMMLVALPVFLITLFLGGVDVTGGSGIAWFALKYVLIIVALTLIRNTNPRLRIDQTIRLFWGPITVLAAVGFILGIFGA